MVRESRQYFLLITIAAFALRLIFYFRFPHVTGDSLIYGDIAKNWLDHGIFGLTHNDGVHPTLIRLPGYPAFLAACFLLFGREHYHAVLLVQIVIDVVTCFFIADLARRTVSERAARFAFLLAALCPFTANYTVAPLAETLSIFFVAVALDAAVAGFLASEEGRDAWPAWTWCGVAVSGGILLRPDGGILLIALGLLPAVAECGDSRRNVRASSGPERLVLAISIAPLVPWTIRNWRDFHRFQPLVPQSASDPDEFVSRRLRQMGADLGRRLCFYRRSLLAGSRRQGRSRPTSFASLRQRRRSGQKRRLILADYNKVLVVNPALNARFMELAKERMRQDPLRYYVWLPALRIADMWLRPRTEMLPLNSRWWEYSDDTKACVRSQRCGAC